MVLMQNNTQELNEMGRLKSRKGKNEYAGSPREQK